MPRTAESVRQLRIAGQPVSYRLRRSARRTIGLTIDHQGLRVAAPQRAPLTDIEALLRTHGRWVLDKLADWATRVPPARPAVVPGMSLSIAGQRVTVGIEPERRRGYRLDLVGQQLWVHGHPSFAEALRAALMALAREDLAARLAVLAPRLGRPVPPWQLSSARTRWGSCSAHGRIRLNWRLILLPPELIDYVVAHELAHLIEMNHGPGFWSVVAGLCPDWRARRAELRRLGALLPEF